MTEITNQYERLIVTTTLYPHHPIVYAYNDFKLLKMPMESIPSYCGREMTLVEHQQAASHLHDLGVRNGATPQRIHTVGQFYASLIPPIICDDLFSSTTLLYIESVEVDYPWELVLYQGRFLGQQRPIGHITSDTHAKLRVDIAPQAILIGTSETSSYQPPQLTPEIVQLQQQMLAAQRNLAVTIIPTERQHQMGMIATLRESSLLYHYSGPLIRIDTHVTGISCTDNVPIIAKDIPAATNHSLLVFLNGRNRQHTAPHDLGAAPAQQTMNLSAMRENLQAFDLVRALRTHGSLGVISTRWPVTDVVAAYGAAAFYERFFAGETLANALYHARQSLSQQFPTDAGWAAYRFDSEPDIAMATLQMAMAPATFARPTQLFAFTPQQDSQPPGTEGSISDIPHSRIGSEGIHANTYAIHVGQRLTDYSNVDVTVQRVAVGGMGLVAMGPDHEHKRWLALKTIKPEALKQNPDLRERFIREGLTWVGLWPHANVLLAESVTEIDGVPFLVLNYAEHGSLANMLNQGRLPLASALLIAQHIAAGLVMLHAPDPDHLRAAPIVHRDLKPDNILFCQLGENQYAQITDFGLVALLPPISGTLARSDDTSMDATRSTRFQTQQGSVMGTAAYMAPEQWQGNEQVGPPVDLYALGLILGQCVTDAHPLLSLHQRHNVDQWRTAHAQGTPQRLQTVVPEVPIPLERLFQSLLVKRAEDRPTAVESLATLNAVAQRLSLPVYTPPVVYAHTPEHERLYWQGWSNAYTRFALWDEALARNYRAMQVAPHDPNMLLNRGNILAGMQRWAEALSCYKASLQASPSDDHIGRKVAYNQIGNLHRQQGAYAAAEATYAQALAEMPDAADAWFNRANNELLWGQAEAQSGQQGAARAHLQRAREHAERSWVLNPANTITPQLLAKIKEASRNLD